MSHRRTLATINITPLVDVLLILLAILLLVMPFFVKKLPVSMPSTGLDAAPMVAHSVQVSLAPQGKLFLGEAPATLDQVLEKVGEGVTVELAIDKAVPFADISTTVVAIQAKKPTEIVFLTN